MMSKSNKIGAVCGTDVVPPVWRFGEGYKAGAAYADGMKGTTTEVFVVYHSDVGFDKTFTDPEWGAATAKSMMDQGADAIFGCGGITGNGAITAAAQAGAHPGSGRPDLQERRRAVRRAGGGRALSLIHISEPTRH